MNLKKLYTTTAALAFGIALVACDSDSSSGPQDEPFLTSSSSQSVSPASSDVTPMSSDSETRVSSSADPESSSSSVAPQPSSSETIVSSSGVVVEYGTLQDPRDGKSYKTVVIGGKTWMAENLNFVTDSSFCVEDIPANCDKYGRFYQEFDAEDACPEGWAIPQASDWRDLTNAVKEEFGDNNGSLRTVGEWENTIFGDNVTATNASGFSALPAGYRAKTGEYDGQGTKAYFWGEDNMNHYAWILSNQYDLDKESLIRGYFAYSIRCIKN